MLLISFNIINIVLASRCDRHFLGDHAVFRAVSRRGIFGSLWSNVP